MDCRVHYGLTDVLTSRLIWTIVGPDSIICGVSTCSNVTAVFGAYYEMLLLSEVVSGVSKRAACWPGVSNLRAQRTLPLQNEVGICQQFSRLTVIRWGDVMG